ncbi:hypothetical protein DVDV_1743 [Desulfovibrio sp. DV]|nr:hypothetical protein DVDV_1743 [Desulfovibrio sp. DV]
MYLTPKPTCAVDDLARAAPRRIPRQPATEASLPVSIRQSLPTEKTMPARRGPVAEDKQICLRLHASARPVRFLPVLPIAGVLVVLPVVPPPPGALHPARPPGRDMQAQRIPAARQSDKPDPACSRPAPWNGSWPLPLPWAFMFWWWSSS